MMAEIRAVRYTLLQRQFPPRMSQQAQTETRSSRGPGGSDFPFALLRRVYSFQSILPALVAAEEELLRAIADTKGGPLESVSTDAIARFFLTLARAFEPDV